MSSRTMCTRVELLQETMRERERRLQQLRTLSSQMQTWPPLLRRRLRRHPSQQTQLRRVSQHVPWYNGVPVWYLRLWQLDDSARADNCNRFMMKQLLPNIVDGWIVLVGRRLAHHNPSSISGLKCL